MWAMIEVRWAKSSKWWSEMIIPSSVQHLISSLSQLCPSCSITISHCESSKPNTESWPVCACWGQFEQVQSAMSNFTLNKNTNLERWVISLTSQPASQLARWRLKVAKTRMMGQCQQLSPSVVHAPLIPGLLVAVFTGALKPWDDLIIQIQPWSKKPSPGYNMVI